MINRRSFLKLAGVSALVASGPSILRANALENTTAARDTTHLATLANSAETSSCTTGYGGGAYGAGEYNVSATNDLITPSVHIGAADDSIMLSWSESTPNANYEVWRSNNPYLIPGDNTGELIATVSTTSYTDQNLVTDGSEGYFYVVRSVDSCQQTSEASNRTGGFNFQIQTGA